MTTFLTRNVSPRAMAAAAAMTLVVSVGMGRENPEPPVTVALAARATVPGAPPEAGVDLDLSALARARRADQINDLFAPRQAPQVAAPPPAAAAEPPPPPAPTAPPLPFTYLGKFVDGERTEVFVALGNEHYTAEKGRTIDGQYRIENVTASAVTFIYLPLGTRQNLAIPAQQ